MNRRILSLLALALLLTSALAVVSPAHAASVSVTAQADYVGGWPPDGASVRCLESGTPTAFGPMTPAGVSANCDASTPLLPDAMGWGGTSSDQFSAVPLTYGLVGYYQTMEGSGSKVYDLSHSNNTLTFGCFGSGCSNPT